MMVLFTLLFLLVAGRATAQYCTDPDPTTLIVQCNIQGPAAGTFFFPQGVSQYTLVSMSSGNGGAYISTTLASDSSLGGFGVQTQGTATLEVTSAGLRYFVGSNGGTSTQFFLPNRIIGGPLSGAGYRSGSGGGPSFILDSNDDVLLSLGAGGGGTRCAIGGAAGAGTELGVYFPGQNGQARDTGANPPIFLAQGGGGLASKGGVGAGGTDDSGNPPGQPGQSDGNGGDAPAVQFYGAGGGGSITGAGGGGGRIGAGGGGNSFNSIEGLTLVQRTDTAANPSLVFQYVAPFVATTTTVISLTTATTTLPTVTSSVTSIITSTTDVSTTTQSPLSTSVTTVQTILESTYQPRRTKTQIKENVTVRLATTTTVLTTVNASQTCVRLQASYPAGCCPAQYKSMQPAPSAQLGQRNLAEFEAQRRRVILAERQLEKRTGSAITSSAVTGGPSVATKISTLSATEISPAPTVTASFTSYAPVVTSTIFFDSAADTTTLTEFSTDLATRTVAPGLTLVVTQTITSFSSPATVTSTVTAQPSACATTNAYTVSQCPAAGNNLQLQRFKKDQLAALYQLKDQSSAAGSGSQVLINCGSSGTYLF